MEDQELKIFKSRVLEAAKSCSQTKEILRKLFPRAFEENSYQCGTIFVDYEWYRSSFPNPFILENLNRFWILAHLKDDRTYGLINLGNGFSSKRENGKPRYPRTFFIRGDTTEIEISDVYLNTLGLGVYYIPPKK